MSSALDGFEPPTRRLFQPLHIGHQFMIDQTLERAENGIVLIGSDSAGRSPRNL
ncbi:cytidyltransferase-like protein [Rhizobium leguminosarum]|uniref:Cytidyltransferase-like protein n=1 Tax=Rhizobium leguminosarum TaxID=384 RepID=A0A7W9ZNC2_RHILE|nr:adenylyltransferase/cytidyltransferase family protein [Rhizobium leguminosarum]MBB5661836.1 cytidyltransferase-like protein [Rhizobium leguminosarum]MBB6219861.1 cytidyltransferase-like protein [Rhizobium leguminosarum]NYJ13309.1 cytidyltransferase-like protein [Rhizobium leguminosarum]